MTISVNNNLFSDTLTAADLKSAIGKLHLTLQGLPDDNDVKFDFDNEQIGITNMGNQFDPFGRYAPPEPGDDIDGDGIPDSIPIHILPYIRQIIQLRAQNAVLRANMLDSLVNHNQLERFTHHLLTGTLKIK